MSATVLVELAPADAASAHSAALLAACSAGVHAEHGCELSTSTVDAASASAVAVVVWDSPKHEGVHIEVGVRANGSAGWRNRRLAFSDEDDEVERWRTVGFAVATLVGERRDEASAPPSALPPPTPSIDRAPVVPQLAPIDTGGVASPEEPRWWAEAFGTVGPGGQGSPRFGGAARLSSRLGEGPWRATAGAEYSHQGLDDGAVSLDLVSFSAGLGVAFPLAAKYLVFDARAEAMVRQIRVAATDSLAGGEATGGRWVVGASERAGLAWLWTQKIGLVASATLSETARTNVASRGNRVASVGPLDFTVGLGVRVTLP